MANGREMLTLNPHIGFALAVCLVRKAMLVNAQIYFRLYSFSLAFHEKI